MYAGRSASRTLQRRAGMRVGSCGDDHDRDPNFRCHRSHEVDIHFGSKRHDQAVPDGKRISISAIVVLPPTADRVDAEHSGLEFLMGYYPVLDHAPKGRAEGPYDWQLWLCGHDEY